MVPMRVRHPPSLCDFPISLDHLPIISSRLFRIVIFSPFMLFLCPLSDLFRVLVKNVTVLVTLPLLITCDHDCADC